MDRRISRTAQEEKAPPKHRYKFPSISGELVAGHSLEMSTETLHHNPMSLLPCSLGDLMQKLKATKNDEMLLADSKPGGDLGAGRQMEPHLLLKTKQDQVGLAVNIC